MRKLTAILAVILMLIGSLLASAVSTSAAPAEPFTYDDCYDYPNGVVYCEQGHGVSKINETPSGNVQHHLIVHYSWHYEDSEGQLLVGASGHFNSVQIVKDGATQVGHNFETATYSIGGTTCSVQSRFQYVNGEVRHDFYGEQCVSS